MHLEMSVNETCSTVLRRRVDEMALAVGGMLAGHQQRNQQKVPPGATTPDMAIDDRGNALKCGGGR